MIGVTQLLSTTEVSSSALGSSANNPFTSYADVASSGLPDDYYYFNDGTRTRQYYFSVDGTAAGQTTGGWARLDATSLGQPYTGQECLSDAGVSSDGIYKTHAQSNGGYGPSTHGGCGVGYANTYFKCRYMCFTNISGNTNTAWGYQSRFSVHNAATTLRTDWNGNQSGTGGSHYPGAFAFPSGSGAEFHLYLSTGSSTTPPSTVTSLSNSASYHHNGNVLYGYHAGHVYDMFTTEDRTFHHGQMIYQTATPEKNLKIWIKY